MRIFGSERLNSMLTISGLKEGEAIVHPWINKALEKAQQKVEARNFDIRKNLLKFDNVMNDQRKVIFDQRIGIMKGEEVSETIDDMRHTTIEDLVTKHIPPNSYAEQWDAPGLRERLQEVLGLDFPVDEWAKEEGIAEEEILERVMKAADEHYAGKRQKYGPEIMNQVEKTFLLRTLDQLWRDHIITVEQLRQVIHLRGYGQRDPLNEYKTEGFNLFESMVNRLRENVTGQVMRVEVQMRDASELTELPDEDELPEMEAHHIDATTGEDDVAEGGRLLIDMEKSARGNAERRARPAIDPNNPKTWGKVSRNDPCPCGSGKRYKHCHGKLS
jgi:preprotein translocase subunit SecA